MRLFFIVILFLLKTGSLLAGNTSDNKIDSLRLRVNSTTGAAKVLAINELSSLMQNICLDSALFYQSLALVEANRCGDGNALFDSYYGLASIYFKAGLNDDAIDYYKKVLAYSSYCLSPIKVASANKLLAFAYRNINQYQAGIEHLQTAAGIAKNEGDYQFEGNAYLSMSRFYRDISKYSKSLECGLKALDIFTEHGLTAQYPNAYRSIAAVHREQNDLSLAEEYYSKAQVMLEKENKPAKLVDLYIELAIFYDRMGNLEKCLDYNYKALNYAKIINNKERLAAIYVNLGYSSFKMGQYKESIEFNEKVLTEFSSFNRDEDELGVYILLANAWIKLNNVGKSEHYISLITPKIRSIVDLKLVREYYNVQGEIAHKKGSVEDVFAYKTLENMYGDSVCRQNQNRAILDMQLRFDTNKQEHEIDMLKAENEEQRIRTNFLYAIVGIFTLFIAAVILFLIINRRKTFKLRLYNRKLELANARLVKSEEELRSSNATKDKLFSIIGHDLKNPFNAMLGFCEMLSLNYNQCSEEQYRGYINVVFDAGRSIYNLLDNLLQWSKTQVGKISHKPVMLNLEQLVEEEMHLLVPTASNKNISIEVEVENNEVVFADQYSISIVVRNLISNALKFTQFGGNVKIVISHRPNSDMVEVAVVDNGVGMTPEEMNKLFKSNGSYTTKGTANEPGTGLGLMLCKEFVESNGGKIWVSSEKGKGSEFHFSLPIAK